MNTQNSVTANSVAFPLFHAASQFSFHQRTSFSFTESMLKYFKILITCLVLGLHKISVSVRYRWYCVPILLVLYCIGKILYRYNTKLNHCICTDFCCVQYRWKPSNADTTGAHSVLIRNASWYQGLPFIQGNNVGPHAYELSTFKMCLYFRGIHSGGGFNCIPLMFMFIVGVPLYSIVNSYYYHMVNKHTSNLQTVK